MTGLDIEGAVVREVFEEPDSSLIFVRVGFRGTDDGEVILWVTNWTPAEPGSAEAVS